MMQGTVEATGAPVEIQFGGDKKVTVLSEAHVDQVSRVARTIWRGPFTKQTWAELIYFLQSSLLTAVGIAFIAVTMFFGIVLAILFVGVIIIAASLRGSRGLGAFHRALARSFIDEHIEEPDPFVSRPGFFGWLGSTFRDRTAWRAMAYGILKVPLVIFGIWFALSIWIDSLSCFLYTLFGSGAPRPGEFGIAVNIFKPGFFSVGSFGFFHRFFVLVSGVALLFVAPWAMRLVINLDRYLMRWLLAPDAMTMRVRSLERSRAQTVDSSAATLRRIERDLHDGTQAQLVALAMRLGQAKDKLGRGDDVDLDQVRRLVDEAHQGAKEAIIELRDLARGIHPPALDVGLEGALATLAARSTVPAEVTVSIYDRPTPAIEAIAYFCVAELLANVAQHAHASKGTVTCAQHGQWLRVVVRDDGQGGARPSHVGSASSGLAGLTERVRAVDGHLDIMSPPGGPTVVAVDLPLHA